ncbi:hypothetical protein ACFRU3_28870 [Streptomyces sp. NPDC056910]
MQAAVLDVQAVAAALVAVRDQDGPASPSSHDSSSTVTVKERKAIRREER